MRLSVVKSRSNEIRRLMRARVFGVGREDPTDVLQHFFFLAMDLQDARVVDPY